VRELLGNAEVSTLGEKTLYLAGCVEISLTGEQWFTSWGIDWLIRLAVDCVAALVLTICG
jgi:hypothetical protein